MNDEYRNRCRQHFKMNPETINDMCKKAEQMKQKQYEGRIQNLTGGYYKAGYENVKISQVKDYFLVTGYKRPHVFKELSDIEEFMNSIPTEKGKSKVVIIPFPVVEESDIYKYLMKRLHDKNDPHGTTMKVMKCITKYRERYYNDHKVSECMPTYML